LPKKELNLTKIIEGYLYHPSYFGLFIAVLLLPLSLLYCLIGALKILSSKKIEFDIPIISVGNLTLGGNGKTPFVISLAKRYKNSAVVLRGYGRSGSGCKVVSNRGEILLDIKNCGDEAMMLSKILKESIIIVSEDRKKGIKRAIELGANVVILDDGFRHPIKKFEILLRGLEEPKLPFCLPSSAYRESPFFYRFGDLVLKEGEDYKRIFTVPKIDKKGILVTAIASGKRGKG